MCREAQEGERCTEVRANLRSWATQNQQDKRTMAGAIEGEKEGARYGRRRNDLELFFKAFCFNILDCLTIKEFIIESFETKPGEIRTLHSKSP